MIMMVMCEMIMSIFDNDVMKSVFDVAVPMT